MSEEKAAEVAADGENTGAEAQPKAKTPPPAARDKNLSRRTRRDVYRKNLRLRLQNDKDFAKEYFAAKSKRSDERKVAYRKRHAAKTS